jgi:hypothetical protein
MIQQETLILKGDNLSPVILDSFPKDLIQRNKNGFLVTKWINIDECFIALIVDIYCQFRYTMELLVVSIVIGFLTVLKNTAYYQ